MWQEDNFYQFLTPSQTFTILIEFDQTFTVPQDYDGVFTTASRFTVLRIGQFFPEPWLAPCRPTTTRPARPRWAGAESRSFERCAPTTSRRDPTPASSTPLRAHGPRAAHICTSTTAMRTRCGEGDLVGGWHAGASPFTPITRWVTKGGSSSASFAHTYTPLGRSQRL